MVPLPPAVGHHATSLCYVLTVFFPAVTHAALTNWEYMDTIRLATDPICSANLVRSVATVDALLNVPLVGKRLKGLFGLADLESDQDFVQLLTVHPRLFALIEAVPHVVFCRRVPLVRGRGRTGTRPSDQQSSKGSVAF